MLHIPDNLRLAPPGWREFQQLEACLHDLWGNGREVPYKPFDKCQKYETETIPEGSSHTRQTIWTGILRY